MSKIKNWLPEGFFFKKEATEKIGFQLVYDELQLVIGTLWFEGGKWYFSYSEAFKAQKDLVPIVDFPDTNKVYESEDLWPFFISRIPSAATPYVKRKIESNKIDKTSLIDMLKLFGENTITSPFKLIFNPNF